MEEGIMCGVKQGTKVHHLHCFDPKNKPTIIRSWIETRRTKCPVSWVDDSNNLWYIAEYVEYTFIDKKGKLKHVPEMMLWCKDLEKK